MFLFPLSYLISKFSAAHRRRGGGGVTGRVFVHRANLIKARIWVISVVHTQSVDLANWPRRDSSTHSSAFLLLFFFVISSLKQTERLCGIAWMHKWNFAEREVWRQHWIHNTQTSHRSVHHDSENSKFISIYTVEEQIIADEFSSYTNLYYKIKIQHLYQGGVSENRMFFSAKRQHRNINHHECIELWNVAEKPVRTHTRGFWRLFLRCRFTAGFNNRR